MAKYEKQEKIGEGSFGQVYRAVRIADRTLVALKFVTKTNRSVDQINMLKKECEIQKGLNHPNIIRMLDSFETDDAIVVVTEFAEKGELSNLLAHGARTLPVKKVREIACDLVAALNYLHSRRILHRDMKPQNILIGNDGLYKLCDFGFARTMGLQEYMLTSIKGTPLYMAPEIMANKPYDHNADLWSLGCILYEMLCGRPPFYATNLIQLLNMVRNNSISFPDLLSENCKSFLKGLLEKDPQKRLTWPGLLDHPFVCDGIKIEPAEKEFSLTVALSPSQEFAKERQRQNLQRKLAGYSKLLMKTTKKVEDTQKKLKKCGQDGKPLTVKTPVQSPGGGNMPSSKPNRLPATQQESEGGQGQATTRADDPNVTKMLKNLKIDKKNTEDDSTSDNTGSSCETLTSSSECDDDESDEDGRTVIIGNSKGSANRDHDVELEDVEINVPGKAAETVWKSGALFTLHNFGSDDKPINTEEWVYFLISTMKEVRDNPKSLCEKHFLTVIVAPLRNHLAGPEVIEKIATLLSVPFTMEKDLNSSQPGLVASIQTIYLDSKVLPNLLYSCKLMIRRRSLERHSMELNEIAGILTPDDLNALDQCIRLVCFLVYSDEDFVVQFCDSVCVFELLPILQLFLKLDKRKSRLASDTLAILCQVMRNIPTNFTILEELFLVEGTGSTNSFEDLWRILLNSNAVIKARALRILAYLSVHSESTKEKLIQKNCSKIWKLLRESSVSMDPQVREAAAFALENMKNMKPSSITSSKESNRSQTKLSELNTCDNAQSR